MKHTDAIAAAYADKFLWEEKRPNQIKQIKQNKHTETKTAGKNKQQKAYQNHHLI